MTGEQHLNDTLTPRELEILRLVALGLSNRDIAEELVVAPETVRWYTKQIYSKLGVHGRVPALVRAQGLGLLDAPASSHAETAPALHAPNHNLPAATTPFIGRSREVTDVTQLLDHSRLLTLTGVGGTGKTRLALHVASQMLGGFADGVYFVDLAPVAQPDLVAKAIAGPLEVVENPNESLRDTLKRALAERELLLVIDNFEHVIEAAPLVSDLLAASPRLKVLVTSREPLRLYGEQVFPVPPLSLPPIDEPTIQDISASEAGMLFLQRVRLTQPGFAVSADNAPAIAQICARLDGLPLALELAAARCKLLTPQALLDRLDSRLTALAGGSRDAPARQRTLRDTIDWSYTLLDEDEQTLFARLAVFRGGCSLAAIAAVCADDLSIDVLDGLESLVHKNLVQQREGLGGEPRFVMLETIHEYAWERLEERGDAAAMRRRHAQYFVHLAERAEPQLRLAQQTHWFDLLETEQDNIRAVLEWALAGEDVILGVELAGALWQFWWDGGYHSEGYQWTQQLLPHLEEVPGAHQPKFVLCAAKMTSLTSHQAAKVLYLEALRLSREQGNREDAAWTLAALALTLVEVDDAKRAMSVAEEALSLFWASDHKPGIAYTLNVIGVIARERDYHVARRAFEECLAVCKETGEARRTARVFYNLGVIAHHVGDAEGVRNWMAQSLRLTLELGWTAGGAAALSVFSGYLGTTGQVRLGAMLLGAAQTALERTGSRLEAHDNREHERNVADLRAQLGEVAFEEAWAEGRKMSLEQAVHVALGE